MGLSRLRQLDVAPATDRPRIAAARAAPAGRTTDVAQLTDAVYNPPARVAEENWPTV
jgi:hypothetical protein